MLIANFSVGSQAVFPMPDKAPDGAPQEVKDARAQARKDKLAEYTEEAKCMVQALHRMPPNASLLSAWSELWQYNGLASKFPHFLKLAFVMLTIPVQSATVERGFSQHNNLKTKLRNAMHVMTLDSALRVQDQVSATNIFKVDLKRASEIYLRRPAWQETRPLLLAQLFEAAGLHDEGGAFPTVLFDGVDVEITDAFHNVGADPIDEEVDVLEGSEVLDVCERDSLAALFADASRCDAVGGTAATATSQQQDEVDDILASLVY